MNHPVMEGLPVRWRAAIHFCPYCQGLEQSPACFQCEGTGDLFGTMLRHAYNMGREDALGKLGEVRNVVAMAITLLEDTPEPTENIKRRLGL